MTLYYLLRGMLCALRDIADALGLLGRLIGLLVVPGLVFFLLTITLGLSSTQVLLLAMTGLVFAVRYLWSVRHA
jgi:hypothetical protein